MIDKNLEKYYKMAMDAYNKKDYKNAAANFEQILNHELDEKEPEVVQIVICYGYSLIYTARLKRALSLQRLYKVFQDNAEYVYMVGTAMINNGMFDEAEVEFHKVIDMEQDNPDKTNLARAYHNLSVISEYHQNSELSKEYEKKYQSFLTIMGN